MFSDIQSPPEHLTGRLFVFVEGVGEISSVVKGRVRKETGAFARRSQSAECENGKVTPEKYQERLKTLSVCF